MRVLFVTVPTRAHAYAQVPVAWALRAAGHEVVVATNPELMDDVADTGLTAVPVGPTLNQAELVEENRQHEEAMADLRAQMPDPTVLMRVDDIPPADLTEDYLEGHFTLMTSLVFQTYSPPAMVDDLLRFARSWRPDLVVWDTLVFAAPVAATVVGAAHARLLYGLDLVGQLRKAHLAALARRPPELRDDPLAEWLGWTLERYGSRLTEDVVLGQWTIDPVPASLHTPVGGVRVPVRYVPYNGPAEVPRWVGQRPTRPRVCLTLGLSFREVMGGDRASVGTLLEAVADLDVEVIATLDAKQLAAAGTLPDNVRTVAFVPLDSLLPTCEAIVHQGGIGQSQTAMAHGVPQLVLPNGEWDTVTRARRLAEADAAIVLDAESVTADDLRRGLLRLLDDPGHRHAAARLRTEMHTSPAPGDVVPTLEALTRRHRRR